MDKVRENGDKKVCSPAVEGGGTLFIVATPIGNLEDITLRALRVLKEVDLIAAEDTRHTRKLLTHYNISKQTTSYFDHNKTVKGEQLLSRLKEGMSIALVSDAGTPCISDPGYQLVRDAVAAGIKVVAVPGPSAVITAIASSGMPSDRFVFEGFLPSKSSKRRERLRQLEEDERLLVFYESPHRLHDALEDMHEVLGNRDTLVCRELTKIFEEHLRGTISDVRAAIDGRLIKGEVVILVAGSMRKEGTQSPEWRALLQDLLLGGKMTLKDAVVDVCQRTGIPRSDVYSEALKIKNQDQQR